MTKACSATVGFPSCCLKVPKPERFQSPADAETYLAQARTIATLDHPHVVPVYDVGRSEGGSIYVNSKLTVLSRAKQGMILAARQDGNVPKSYERPSARTIGKRIVSHSPWGACTNAFHGKCTRPGMGILPEVFVANAKRDSASGATEAFITLVFGMGSGIRPPTFSVSRGL